MTNPSLSLTRLKSLPKCHLHVHLEGAARATTIADLAARHQRALPDITGFTDLAGLVNCYRKVTDLIRSPADLALIISEFVADEADHGVLYSEPMIGPWLYADRFAWSLTDTFVFIDDTFQQAAHHHGVEVRYLVGVNWSRPTEFIDHAAAFAVQHANRNVAGLGFAGIEPAGGFERFTPAAATVRANGLLVVPHIGETQGPQAIHAALTALTPHRIAHGVHAADDLRLLDQLTASAIPCDVSLTSNIRLGIYNDPADHPLSTLLKHGVTITLNADDPLLAATTLSDEYLQFSRSLGLTDRHMADLAAAGATAAGITDTTRTTLHTSITQWLADTEPRKGQP